MKINIRAVKILMAQKQMTHAQLAELAGISRPTITTLLTRGTCSIPNAGKLADALGVEVEAIIDES